MESFSSAYLYVKCVSQIAWFAVRHTAQRTWIARMRYTALRIDSKQHRHASHAIHCPSSPYHHPRHCPQIADPSSASQRSAAPPLRPPTPVCNTVSTRNTLHRLLGMPTPWVRWRAQAQSPSSSSSSSSSVGAAAASSASDCCSPERYMSQSALMYCFARSPFV